MPTATFRTKLCHPPMLLTNRNLVENYSAHHCNPLKINTIQKPIISGSKTAYFRTWYAAYQKPKRGILETDMPHIGKPYCRNGVSVKYSFKSELFFNSLWTENGTKDKNTTIHHKKRIFNDVMSDYSRHYRQSRSFSFSFLTK